MKAIDIPFTVVVGAFRNDNVRMYADADSVSETRNVAVYEIVSTVMGAKDEWSDKDAEVFPI